MGGGNREPKILEPFIAASRGRGENNVQHLEPRKDGLTNTLTSVANVVEPNGGLPIKTANKKGYDMAVDGDGIDLGYPDSKTRRGRVGHGVAKTLPTSDSQGVVEYRFFNQAKETAKDADDGDIIDAFNHRVNKTGVSPTITTRPEGFKTAILPVQNFRIRKLTPLECWRLMGFVDTDFHKAERVNSNTQLYKQAGNSIVVNVLEAILKELLDGSTD